jgi:intein/homing endonuclease/phage terminase large subunit-like protein
MAKRKLPGPLKSATQEELAEIKRLRLEKLKLQVELHESLPHLYGFPFYKWSREFFESTNPMMFLTAANQISKPVVHGTLIPTPNGLVKIEDLKIGDQVFGSDGKPCDVVDIPYDGIEDVYRFTFCDNTTVDCGLNHDWICMSPEERFRKQYVSSGTKRRFDNPDYRKWKVYSTKEILEVAKYKPTTDAPRRFAFPVAEAVEYPNKGLFDPYYIGLIIGNGGGPSICFHSIDTALIDVALRYGNEINHKEKSNRRTISIPRAVQHSLPQEIRAKSFEKRIPREYLLSSIEERKLLLAGLMDTDGTVDKKGVHASYSTTSELLADDVAELVTSLGGIAHIRRRKAGYRKDGVYHKCRDCFVVTIWTKFNPFLSQRKAERWRYTDRYKFERVLLKVDKLEPKQMRCITVSNADGSFLCTTNHIVTHNSSTQIRKFIHWATAKELWPKLWRTQPRVFWYLYPSLIVASKEIEKKWIPEFLPRGKYKTHPVYGWDIEKDNGLIVAIHFKSGVSIYMKSYSTNEQLLQTGTVWYLGFDEEMPEELWPELVMRVAATDGYISGVFTPTLSQQFWYDVMEKRGEKNERFPRAHKITASLYDSQVYEDGTPSPWTKERITRILNSLPSDDEIQRRVYGRFIMDRKGLKYPSFSKEGNVITRTDIPADWLWYYGIDSGSGGFEGGHPAAIVGVAVDPRFTKGVVAECWIGTPENVEGDDKNTTAGDILGQYIRMSTAKKNLMGARYDFADKDLEVIASRNGIHLEKADKSHETGEGLLNTLFKNKLLNIHDTQKNDALVLELMTLRKEQNKRKAKDHLIDALRYCVTGVPWDLSVISDRFEIKSAPKAVVDPYERQLDRSWQLYKEEEQPDYNAEIAEWNDLYGSD